MTWQAELIEEARRDNERKSTDSAFQGALKAIDKAIDSAQLYSKRMEVASGLKFRDEDLGITTQPEHFNGHLRDYQLKGFQWIVRRAFAGESIILADEMGLGACPTASRRRRRGSVPSPPLLPRALSRPPI